MIATPPPKTPPRSAWQLVGFSLVVLLILGLLTGGIGVAWYNKENPAGSVKPNPYGYRSNTRAPYGSPGALTRPGGFPAPPDATAEADAVTSLQIRTFFDAFGKALRQKNAAAEPWIDTAAVLADAKEMLPVGLDFVDFNAHGMQVVPAVASGETAALTTALRQARSTWRGWDWNEFAVHRVNRLTPNSFEVITSTTKADGSRIKMLWRLESTSVDRFLAQPVVVQQNYAIAHWTDLDTGLSSGFHVALSLISHSADAGRYRRLTGLRSLADAHRDMDEKKYDEARKHLDVAARAQAAEFADFENVYELAEARYDIGYSDDGSTFDRLEAILERDRTNLPALMLQMRVHAQNRQWGDIAELARRYQDQTGPDADALAWAGVEQAGLEEPEKARELFERASKLDPNHVVALNGLRKAIPADQKRDYVKRVAESKLYRMLFHRLIDDILYDDWNTVESLARAHRKRFPDDESAARHLVRALLMQDDARAATDVYREVWPKLKGEARAKLTADFLQASSFKKLQVEAYDAVPAEEQSEAFRHAMQSWDYQLFGRGDEGFEIPEDIDEKSRKLLDRHAKAHADNVWVSLYKAKFQNRDDDRAGAEKNAKAFLDRVKPSADGTNDYRSGYQEGRREWLLAKVHLDQTVSAYERFPDGRTFDELAQECLQGKKDRELNLLLAAREKAEPKFATGPYWRGELHWLVKDYPRCAAEMKTYLDDMETGVYTPFQYQALDRLIRSYVKANNPSAATEYLKGEEYPMPLLQALALAAGQKSEEAEVFLIDAMTKQMWLVHQAYSDPDLGPILQGPAFARLREKHPPPVPAKKKPLG